MSSGSGRGRSSRRGFLKGVGAAGAGLIPGSVGAGPATADPAPGPLAPRLQARAGEGAPARSVELGRIFPALPPFAEASDKVRAVLVDLGSPGGIMDAGDQLSAGPKALIVDPTVNGNPTAKIPTGRTLTTPTMTAGSTFVGQFTDHDITFDQTSQLGVPQNPLVSPSTRTPALDLDSVFGGGPGRRPDRPVLRARLRQQRAGLLRPGRGRQRQEQQEDRHDDLERALRRWPEVTRATSRACTPRSPPPHRSGTTSSSLR